MRKDNKEKRDKVVEDVRNLLMKTIVSYCVKSGGGVDMTLLIKAMADVLAGQLAVLSEDWTEEETARVVDGFLSYIVKTVKECRAEPDTTDEYDDLVKEILGETGKD